MSGVAHNEKLYFGIHENNIFVKILSKYKVILDTQKAPTTIRKRNAAAAAMVAELNQKLERKLTVKQLLEKVHRMKHRLKEKQFKNKVRRKKIPYLQWERTFFKLCPENEHPAKKSSDVGVQPSKQPEDIIKDFEVHYNMLEDDCETGSERSLNWESESDHEEVPEPVVQLQVNKRAALINRIKSLKVQEEIYRAEERMHLCKLSVLQKQNDFKFEK